MSTRINPFCLDGRQALLTGSCRGIGFELARGLGRAGAKVLINGRDNERTHAACAKLRDEGSWRKR